MITKLYAAVKGLFQNQFAPSGLKVTGGSTSPTKAAVEEISVPYVPPTSVSVTQMHKTIVWGPVEMTDVELLRAVREKLSAPERWTKGCVARDARGVEGFSRSPTAVSWCLIGAADAVYPGWNPMWQNGEPQDVVGVGACRMLNLLAPYGRTFVAVKRLNQQGGQGEQGPVWHETAATLNDRYNTKHQDVLFVLDIAIEYSQRKVKDGHPRILQTAQYAEV